MSQMPPNQGVVCPRCRSASAPGKRFCTQCGAPLIQPSASPPRVQPQPNPPPRAYVPPPPPVAAPPVFAPQPGRFHSPVLALLFGLLIPGAGQAYNGQPIKGFFLLFFSALILPYFYSLFDAYFGARRIAQFGGRMGKGGFFWVGMQGWLWINVLALAAIGLTIGGVLL